MKLIHKSLEKDNGGSLTLIPEEEVHDNDDDHHRPEIFKHSLVVTGTDMEDMWHIYNLITAGDSVRASTIRKVTTESNTGSTTSNRIRTTLTISVEDIDFDTQACKLRLKGRNIEENDHVKMGAYHTIDLEANRKFTLTKPEWDSVALERIEMATDPSKSADLAAVIMQEGLAHVCFVTNSLTLVKAKIDINLPRKRRGNTQQHEKALHKFYEAVMTAILRHVNFDVAKCILLASPGFTKDQFFEYMVQQAIKTDNKVILENKSKFVLCHASSGFKHSLREVLQDPSLQARLADTKASEEVRMLEAFFKMMQTDQHRAFYGEKHVFRAAEAQAIECLLISDKLFRAQDINTRKKFVKLVDDVREFGGTVKIFSSMHVSGEQLEQFTGLCAILRFPMEELEDSDESDSD